MFDDTSAKRQELARVVQGDFDRVADKLDAFQDRRAGAFVTVNATDGKGRQAHNVQRVRAVFVDLDGAPLAPVLEAGLEPHIVVESSPGRFHAYWLIDDCPLDQFERVQRALARRFDGDPRVHDLPRVMRLPGFRHFKGAAETCEAARRHRHHGPAIRAQATLSTKLKLELESDRGGTQLKAANGAGGDDRARHDRHAHLFALGRSMARRSTPDAVHAALAGREHHPLRSAAGRGRRQLSCRARLQREGRAGL